MRDIYDACNVNRLIYLIEHCQLCGRPHVHSRSRGADNEIESKRVEKGMRPAQDQQSQLREREGRIKVVWRSAKRGLASLASGSDIKAKRTVLFFQRLSAKKFTYRFAQRFDFFLLEFTNDRHFLIAQ
jgi:hypothetical protein